MNITRDFPFQLAMRYADPHRFCHQ